MTPEQTVSPVDSAPFHLPFGRYFWILPVALLSVAQMAVIFTWGTKMPGPPLVNLGDLLFNFLCLFLVLRAARQSTYLARYFWYVTAFCISLFCVAAFLNFYVAVTHPFPFIEDLSILVSVFWFCPVSLMLFLEPDFEPRRFDPIHILDFTQIVLLWVVIYFFFLYMPNHEASGSPFASSWLHETWVGSLMYDGVMAAIFLLRSALTNSPVVRALFGRIGVFLVLVCLGDFYYNYLGATLQAGSWYEVIWTVLNVCPIVIAGTWDQEKIEKAPNRRLFGDLAGNRLFPILFGFLVLVLSLYIARERTLFALVIVAISFSGSSLRLVIAQQRQDRVQLDLQAEIVQRQRIEQMLRQNEEHLGELVAERTVKLEESRHQLRQAQKMEAIGRLAGGIAHDFNNLLTVIRGYSRLLLDRAAGHEFRGGLERIDDAAERAASLTSQLLAFSRRQVLQPKVFNLNVLVQNLEKMLRRLINEDIEMRTVLASDLGSVRADRSQVEQVIMNMVVNARDAMPNGGKLTVETSNIFLDEAYATRHQTVQTGHYVLLAVSDTGAGIEPENLTRIFEPFFTTKELGKGTGLGLSMVYGIIKQSGGNIWVYSEPGRGTSFKIYLPMVNAPAEPLSVEQSPAFSLRGAETILIAEDDEQVRELASEALSASGYSVLVAETPQDAVSICRSHKAHIDLLLTDVVMPGIGGRELSKQVTAIRPDLKILYMSGYTPQAILHHGELDANTFFIQKPFTPSSLAAKVREVLGHVPAGQRDSVVKY
ncbi:MAG TPA: ATP-binding protein [Candidatus Dormibacteraeota bacterium]|jgi:two-component system cell cycle sensor histidine kinase/response regulator CckA|nr:ATP-binding protein [Candidatus Dormibacteraeota bacterium]